MSRFSSPITSIELDDLFAQVVHPGVLLREAFMEPLHLTPEQMAKSIPRCPGFPDSDVAKSIHDLIRVASDWSLDIDLALALDRYFGQPPGYFWRVQAECEISDYSRQLGTWLARVRPFRSQSRHVRSQEKPAKDQNPHSKAKSSRQRLTNVAGSISGLPEILRIATDVIGRPEAAALWLDTPQRALGWRTPSAIARTKKGKTEVLNLLGSIEDGGYI